MTDKLSYEFLELSEKEREEWFREIVTWAKRLRTSKNEKPVFVQSPTTLRAWVNEKIDRAEIGWENCPDDIAGRIKFASGYDRENPNKVFGIMSSNIHVLRKDTKDEILHSLDPKDDSIAYEIVHDKEFKWTKDEIVFIIDRANEYKKAYSFNSANDKNNIIALILEEVRLRKFQKQAIIEEKPDKNLNTFIKDSIQNINKLQDSLGITAKHRREKETNELTLEDISDVFFEKVNNPEQALIYSIEEMIVLIRKIVSGDFHKNTMKLYFNMTFEEALDFISSHAEIEDEALGTTLNKAQFKRLIKLRMKDFERPNLKKDFGFKGELGDFNA